MLAARGLVVAPPGRSPAERAACGPLDLEVAPAGWCTVLGGNGAGKSTLLATLAGLLPPVAGTVRIAGHDPFTSAGRRPARAAVGIVFQEPETQTVTGAVDREIAFPLENLGWPRPAIEARVEELLALFALVPARRAPLSHLSGGEAQRVALAAAMAPGPGLLVLDEPASYLDPAGREALLEGLAALRARHGTAIVWSACEDRGEGPPDGRVIDLGSGGPGRVGRAEPEPGRAPPAGPPAGAALYIWEGRDLRLVRRDERGEIELWGGLDLTIGAGERVVLRGESGAGKTALLDALAGLVEPGRAGSLTSRRPPGGLGYLTQFPESQLFAETVGDDVGFVLRHATPAVAGSERAGRVADALARVGLDPAGVAGRSPDALSLGEQRRVALAGVLVGGPGAILLDEPTAGLDAAGRRDLEAALEAAAAAGATLVVASHEPRWAGRPGWRVLTLPPPLRSPPGRGSGPPHTPVTRETA